jgi:hypothetical protein
VPFVWTAAANGLVTGTAGTNLTRLLNGVDRLFDQSPYLGEGKFGSPAMRSEER